MPRVLVAPQEFKGSLTAREAAHGIADGARRALSTAMPGAVIRELPMADGGPGTAELIREAAGGEQREVEVEGPLGDPVRAAYVLLPSGVAVVEAATSAGLLLVPSDGRDPARASTFGVGQLIGAAAAAGAGSVVVGVGGTGTNDGGAGAAQVLGLHLLDAGGRELPRGGLALLELDRVERAGAPLGPPVRIAVDVTNTLLGPAGATAVYGPQKGVTPELRPRLEAALERWAAVIERDLGIDVRGLEGGGAGGGLPVGLVAATGASIERGAALVGEVIGLADAIAWADVVVTGEGSLDEQTSYGKAVGHVAAACAAAGRPCLAVAGSATGGPTGIEDIEVSTPEGMSEEQSIRDARPLVAAAAERLLLRWAALQAGRRGSSAD